MSRFTPPTGFLTTSDVAKLAGVHRDTILRWLRTGVVAEPKRDRHGWRVFTLTEAHAIARLAKDTTEYPIPDEPRYRMLEEAPRYYLANLQSIDWDFKDAKTNYLTHGIHPYPAKFIPQIPNALIQELSSVGDTVGDIFCGSGTTMVEALTLKRNAVGLDANPLACLISRAKTTNLTLDEGGELIGLAQRAKEMSNSLSLGPQLTLFPTPDFQSRHWRPNSDALNFWFASHVIEELAECLSWCGELSTEGARTVAYTAFSAIVVTVSKQDSDTRYVRREKLVPPGETFARFARSLEQATRAVIEFSELAEERFFCKVIECNILKPPPVPPIDLIVTSPPYPNAYSYHLYHMTRMMWLQLDQPSFKANEIGSHRKYSKKGKTAATVDTFRAEMASTLEWLTGVLRKGGLACFVVGDSTVRGERIDNGSLISSVAESLGFREVLKLSRELQSTKKSFNPSHGRIKKESILILENWRGSR